MTDQTPPELLAVRQATKVYRRAEAQMEKARQALADALVAAWDVSDATKAFTKNSIADESPHDREHVRRVVNAEKAKRTR